MYINDNLIIENLTLEIELLKLKRDKAVLETKLLQILKHQLSSNEYKIKKCCNTCKHCSQFEKNPKIKSVGVQKVCIHEKHIGHWIQEYTVCDEWEGK